MAGEKAFDKALRDGFQHITDISDPEQLGKLRREGIQVDQEGYWSFTFGERGEFELCLEPILDEGMYYVALYKNRVLLTEKLPIKALDPSKDL